jgi:hypothetical protein
MTDTTLAAAVPPVSVEQKYADDIQPLIDAASAVVPPVKLKGAKAFFKRYLKGEIALAGVAAAYVATLVPIDSLAAHIAAGVLSVATVIGILASPKNGL